MSVDTHNPLEQSHFEKSRLVMRFLTSLGVTEIYSFKLVLEKKKGKKIPEPSRLEFLEKFIVDNFALPDTENTIYVAVTTMRY